MKRRIPAIEEFVCEQQLYEGTENESVGSDSYAVDFIKNKGYDSQSAPTYTLLLKDVKTGTIYAFPEIFSYVEGWSQGTGRSTRGWYLTDIVGGEASNGSGQSSPSTPIYVDDRIRDIIKAWKGTYYSKDKIAKVQDIVCDFPKGTKKADIAKSLS